MPRPRVADLEGLLRAMTQADLARLREVVDLAKHKKCLTAFVTAHFGEKLPAPCGHCDRCCGIKPGAIPRSRHPSPSEEELRQIRALRDERHAALNTPRQLARFLCGISSPAVTRARLLGVANEI